jgi:peptidyl-tRNA hydrolase
VLGEFEQSEKEMMNKAIERAAEAIEQIAAEGIEPAMNIYNRAE